jgi:hypothetical protein
MAQYWENQSPYTDGFYMCLKLISSVKDSVYSLKELP